METAIETHTDLMGKWKGLAGNMTEITKKETHQHHSNRRVQTRQLTLDGEGMLLTRAEEQALGTGSALDFSLRLVVAGCFYHWQESNITIFCD